MATKSVPRSPKKKMSSTSGKTMATRVNTRSSKKLAQSPKRQPQRCKRCPGNPFRSHCVHTKHGREFLANQAAVESLRTSTPAPERNLPLPTDLGNESPVGATPFTSPAITPSRPSQLPNPFISSQSTHQHVGTPMSNISSQITTPRSNVPSVSVLHHRQSAEADASSPNSGAGGIHVMTSSHLASLSVRSSSQSSSAGSASRPNRTSAQNPYNGYVDGAYRGSSVYQIVRGHRLPSPISDNTRSVKKFTNTINSIIEKCEDISKETGCWLFIGAQHATARAGSISYASPRLRRDAAEQVGQIGTQFSTLTRNLIHSRTQETLDLQRQLEQSRRETEEAKKSLEAVQENQKELRSILDRFREQYHIDV
ncbi:hypothetical protein JR316_0008618 [Psilocybe cubensis]|uniref:Uncharacterized protein n=2 Tax=Psilocybe cubensis TaxID=181762 RepID=A0A8H8CJI8_PSICU|nr:hypothetical protein JR316_0008618 [Psilocybe cubensis]KAH9478165.1 hypothetical protein JR316_0008618 [Psilocybe cubensis]